MNYENDIVVRFLIKYNYAIAARTYAEIFEENEEKVFIKIKGHQEHGKYVRAEWILISRKSLNRLWTYRGKMFLKQVKELATKHNFQVKLN